MTAGVGALLGLRPYLAWGKVALVGDVDPVGRQAVIADPHSWTMFEDAGICDLSFNFHQSPGKKWKTWPSSVVLFQAPQIQLRIFPAEHNEEWQRTVRDAHDQNGFYVLYAGGTIEYLSVRYLRNALTNINSPLCDDLRNLKDPEIYSKAILHLWGVHNRRRKSLSVAGISQSDAWKNISKMENGVTEWLAREALLPEE